MKVAISHPTGNQNVRALINVLADLNLLAEFSTTVVADPEATWINVLPERLRQEWLRRTFPVSYKYVWTHPARELLRALLTYFSFGKVIGHGINWIGIDAVYNNFDLAVSRRLPHLVKKYNVDTVYAYEDGALSTFRVAKALGLKCVYDLPIAYWETVRTLLTEESERLPLWADTLGGGIQDSAAKLERKIEELQLADSIVCPGQFVNDSIPAWASEKRVIMAPFGSPNSQKREEKNLAGQPKNRPLRVLFVGSMGQRKGLGDLFAAMRILNNPNIELIVMGGLLAPIEFYRSEMPHFTYEPQRPHEQVLALMKSCDVFCLPSIVEGRALVMQEAMSQGLPLIITPNTGGSDLIIEGRTGFLVPIRSPEVIAEKINWFFENRSALPEMRHFSQQHAARYTWENYARQVIESISTVVTDQGVYR